MKLSFEFYDTRAREAAELAREATLENVRDRNLRAEKTWRQLADQARKVVAHRAKALAGREAKDAEEDRGNAGESA